MSKLNNRLEASANVLIVIAALMLMAFVGQRFLLGSSYGKKGFEPMRPTIGKKVELPGVEISDDRKTVFLALQISCRYCAESMPFYRRMLQESDSEAVRFVAVLPTRREDGVKYLAENGIENIDVIQAPLSSLNAGSTPTIVLADEHGSVTSFWIGKLPTEKEAEVIASIGTREK